jgi:hypothetical protein
MMIFLFFFPFSSVLKILNNSDYYYYYYYDYYFYYYSVIIIVQPTSLCRRRVSLIFAVPIIPSFLHPSRPCAAKESGAEAENWKDRRNFVQRVKSVRLSPWVVPWFRLFLATVFAGFIFCASIFRSLPG